MSRVEKAAGQKWMNVNNESDYIDALEDVITDENGVKHYGRLSKISDWLWIKYRCKYSTYRNKSAKRRQELREEFEADTGIHIKVQVHNDWDEYTPEEMEEFWHSIGVPTLPDGTPLGIGDD